MPWILRLAMIASVLAAALTGLHGLALVERLVGAGPDEYYRTGVTIRGMRVSVGYTGLAYTRDEFIWDYMMPAIGGQLVLCALAIGAASGLYRRRYWARPFFLGLVVAALLFSVAGAASIGSDWSYLGIWLLTGGAGALFLWWVLYRREDVVDFFEELREAPVRSESSAG